MERKNKKGLIALAFGTLGLGITEFVLMGILPYVAKDLHIGIATAGHLISAYALGVCMGAPLLVVVRRQPLKRLLLLLVSLSAIGSIGSVIAPTFRMMLACRFISGLPHGAYFGVASIVAEKLAKDGKSANAVSIMISGMTFANLFGVPFGTALSVNLSWRATFIFAALWNMITIFYIWKWVPQVEGVKDAGLKGQFRFLKSPAPWLLLFATMLGNGGIFSWYSYINPLLTEVASFKNNSISTLMVFAGAGMVLGNLAGGRLADHFTPGRTAAFMQGLSTMILMLIFFLFSYSSLAVVLMIACTFCLFAVSSPLQLLIIRYSRGGELLGAACIQIAFNLGNAIGAYTGGIPVNEGYGFEYPALVGAPMALSGFTLLIMFVREYERKGLRYCKWLPK